MSKAKKDNEQLDDLMLISTLFEPKRAFSRRLFEPCIF